MNINTNKMKKTLLALIVILSGLTLKAQQTTLIDSGSIIIDMGVLPQTIGNGLKPYGLIYALMAAQTPVIWSINSAKVKDGVDFIHNGRSYSGGPFIVNADQRSHIVDSILRVWEPKGVELDTTVSAFFAPLSIIIRQTINWTLDLDNGAIAEDYFLNAQIPSSAYIYKSPDSLGKCDQVFVMPHADPTWAIHKNLLKWNSSLDSGGSAGTIWAACHAVSVLENIVNPSNSNQKMNFLMQNGVGSTKPAIDFGSHGNPAFPPAPKFAYPGDNVMQFMGDPTPAMLNGSEQVFLPTTGWRPSTKIAIWDDNQADTVSKDPKHRASLFAYGYAFGDTTRGEVFYQGGHDHNKAKKGVVTAEMVTAQRAMLNFSFLTATKKQINIEHNLPANVTIESGKTALLVAEVVGGNSLIINYKWTSPSCAFTFSDDTNDSTIITAPVVTKPDTCYILLRVDEGCATNRSSYLKVRIYIVPPVIPSLLTLVDKNLIYKDSTVTGNVLTNDQGFGRILTLDKVNGTTIGTATVITTALGGKLTISNNGFYSYKPATGFIGTDRVTQTVCNDLAVKLCKTEDLIIKTLPLPDPTIPNFNSIVTIPENPVSYEDTVAFNPVVNDFDPEGDNIIFKGVQNPNNLTSFVTSGTVINLPGTDTANNAIANAGKVTVAADGSLVFIPKALFIGNVKFNYKVCDDNAIQKCDTQQITIDVLGKRLELYQNSGSYPVALEDFIYTEMGRPVLGAFSYNDYDNDKNDLIKVKGQVIDRGAPSMPIDTLTTNVGGSVVFNSNGTYLYKPKAGFSGTDYVVYTISDNGFPSKSAKATIHMLVPPIVSDYQDFSKAKYGEVYTKYLDGGLNTQGGAAPCWLGANISNELEANTNDSATGDQFDDGLIVPSFLDYKKRNVGQDANTFSVIVNSSVPGTNVYFKLWVDWNNDGTMDSTATGFGTTHSPDTVATGLIIPLTFLGGYVNFRLVAQTNAALLNYSTLNGGEIEDYQFNFPTPLPVTLLGINANLVNGNAFVSWSTSMELNNSHFEVQRMIQGETEFKTIGVVAGAGNSNQLLNYTYKDGLSSVNTGVVFYRLKQVDFNGVLEYSEMVSVRMDGLNGKAKVSAYPNPATSEVFVNLQGLGEYYNYTFINILGKSVLKGTAKIGKQIDVSMLAKGVYSIAIITDTNIERNAIIAIE